MVTKTLEKPAPICPLNQANPHSFTCIPSQITALYATRSIICFFLSLTEERKSVPLPTHVLYANGQLHLEVAEILGQFIPMVIESEESLQECQ